MNLSQILTFLEVAKQNSFRKAARELTLTQPAVSAQIRSPRKSWAPPCSCGNGFASLPAAKLSSPTRAVAALLEEGKQAVQDTEELLRGKLTIGATSGAAITILPASSPTFGTSAPSSGSRSTPCPGIRWCKEYWKDDWMRGSIIWTNLDHLQNQVLFYDTLTLIAPTDHPAAREPYFRLENLKETPLISLVPEATERKLMDQILWEKGIRTESSIELTSLEEVKRMVREGLGLALIPRLCLDPVTDSALRQLRVPGLKNQLPVVLLYPKERYHSSALRRLLNDIRGIYTPEEEWS